MTSTIFVHIVVVMSMIRKLFFLESFNIWRPLLMIVLYLQTKIPISFLCKWKLSPISLIQPSETLPIELTGTHNIIRELKQPNNEY